MILQPAPSQISLTTPFNALNTNVKTPSINSAPFASIVTLFKPALIRFTTITTPTLAEAGGNVTVKGAAVASAMMKKSLAAAVALLVTVLTDNGALKDAMLTCASSTSWRNRFTICETRRGQSGRLALSGRNLTASPLDPPRPQPRSRKTNRYWQWSGRYSGTCPGIAAEHARYPANSSLCGSLPCRPGAVQP